MCVPTHVFYAMPTVSTLSYPMVKSLTKAEVVVMLIALRILSAIVYAFIGGLLQAILLLLFSEAIMTERTNLYITVCFIVAIVFGYIGFYINTYWNNPYAKTIFIGVPVLLALIILMLIFNTFNIVEVLILTCTPGSPHTCYDTRF